MCLNKIADFIGSLVCHQLHERTIFLDAMPLPVCARDTGIYLGIFISLVFITIVKRWDADRPPKLCYTLLLCLFTIPMMIDGITSYLGFRESNNLVRIITGGLFGLPIPIFLASIMNFKALKKNSKPSLRSWTELLLLTIICMIFLLLVYKDILFPWWSITIIIIVSMLIVFYRFALTVISLSSFIPVSYRSTAAILLSSFWFGILYSFNRLIILPLKNLLWIG